MKTLLFAPMYLNAPGCMERHTKWLDYMKPLQSKIGYNDILFVDNASKPELLAEIERLYPYVKIIKKTVSMSRGAQHHAYPYWYRAHANALKYAIDNNYDKAVHIDTDVYVFTNRLCEYIKNLTSGWTTTYCNIHNFPESTLYIVGKDQLVKAHQFMSEDFLVYYPYKMAETEIPWTNIERKFIGDRYGEKNLPQAPNMDFYGQALPHMTFKFEGT
jgi:hypothetical protein